ncbi:MAG: DUF2062 domain-containing protein [Bacteroidales bacterium]|jgi:uncharacterized protein (DUF2062 family)|nr:DUF2062 domain-containing protein [Bacteroidales bacterium]
MKKNKQKTRGIKGLFKLKGEPQYVAKGFALGSFIGMMPIPGFQMLVSLAIASIIRVHKTAAIIGVFNTNIATGAFVFAFNYWLGKTILGLSPNFEFPDKISLSFINTILLAGSDVFLSMVVGGLLSGITASIISYYAVLYILNKNLIKENA